MQQNAQCDRMLLLAPQTGGTRARFWISTFSWFDMPDRKSLPRPNLEALAEALNALEGTTPKDATCWRTQNSATASPELWFGTKEVPLFSSHIDSALHPSRLPPATIKSQVVDALRAAWIFEKEDDTGDIEDIYAV